MAEPTRRGVEIEIQTDTHPVEKHIDPKYNWNEWQIRQEAVRLADLKTKKTHSAQTVDSNFRRESETQHYAPKDAAVQRGIAASTNVETQKRYITGMRGGPDAKLTVHNITLDL
eukprot:TRINITY_DN9419_c0_g1_i1.p2 TRINITY_DN9419_c0_g1~~TRINITY_DN9419_c0_g1_i1.p2  ORF type:complete len:114 (+),score=4.08 TRINITY_DN9419_c0_g1_i1:115-456(+)